MNATSKLTASICLYLVVGALTTSCASSGRYIKSADQTPPPPSIGVSGGDQTLLATIDYLIIPDGGGSWIEHAGWDEYVVTLRNLSGEPVTVEKIRLVDSRGIYLDRGVSPGQLEKRSEALLKEYQDIGITIAIGVAPAVIGGVALAGGALGTAAGVAVLAPVAFIAAPAYYFGKKYANEKDQESIEGEFNRRRLGAATFSGNATFQGSLFYPIVPNPRSLAIDYRKGREFATLEVSLERLDGLHIAPGE